MIPELVYSLQEPSDEFSLPQRRWYADGSWYSSWEDEQGEVVRCCGGPLFGKPDHALPWLEPA